MMSSRLRCSIQGLGFCKVHFNFQNLHFYSTKSPNQSNNSSPNKAYIYYLVNNLGFSPEQALSTSTKFSSKYGNYFKFSDNANSVVNLFKQYGFDDTHIKKMVSCHPRILACNVDKTLIPKFKHLQDQGFFGSNLVSVISLCPYFVLKNMYPVIPVLRAILGSNENIMKLFRRSHFANLTASGLVNLNSNIAVLTNEYGVDIQVIRKSILQHPESYLKNTQFFRNILVKVEEELGIPRNSGAFLYGIYLLCKSSKKVIESKCQLLKSFGWTENDVSELMRRSPCALLISEENIRQKLGFLMTKLSYKPEYLVTHPALLGYSMEKRLVPRYRVLLVLKEKGLLDYNLYTAATKTEKQFLKIFIEPFKEDAPGLLELYLSNKGCSNIDAISR